jgi:hypothetical protein
LVGAIVDVLPEVRPRKTTSDERLARVSDGNNSTARSDSRPAQAPGVVAVFGRRRGARSWGDGVNANELGELLAR